MSTSDSLDRYLDGGMDPEEQRAFEAQLARSPALAGELELSRSIERVLAGRCAPPVGVGARSARRIRRRGARGALLLAAASLAALAGAWWIAAQRPNAATPAEALGARMLALYREQAPEAPSFAEACISLSPSALRALESSRTAMLNCGQTLAFRGSRSLADLGCEGLEFDLDGRRVWLWLVTNGAGPLPELPVDSGLFLFEGQLDGQKVFELTPSARPQLLERLQDTGEALKRLGYMNDPDR